MCFSADPKLFKTSCVKNNNLLIPFYSWDTTDTNKRCRVVLAASRPSPSLRFGNISAESKFVDSEGDSGSARCPCNAKVDIADGFAACRSV